MVVREQSERRRKIDALAVNTSQFDPSPEQFAENIRKLAEFSQEFLETSRQGDAVLQDAESVALSEKLNDQPSSLDNVLTEFNDDVLPFGFNPSSGAFFGYVPGGGLPSAALGDYLAALTNRYAGVYQASPGAAEVENLCIKWLCQLVGYPGESWGALLSGGTLATLTCVIAARELRPRSEWDQSAIYVSNEIHNAIDKSLKVAGLAGVPTRRAAVSDEFKIDMVALREQIKRDKAAGLCPWMIFASAGTVNTGAIDPLDELADLCAEENIWLHVDGAYGGCFVLTPEKRAELKAIARADSLVLDPHKGLFLPYGCGAALVKRGQVLKSAFSMTADYLADVEDHEHSSPADYSPELTRHFRGLRLWFSFKLHGLQRFRDALTEKLLLAEEVYDRLREMPELVLGPAPNLSIVTYRLKQGDEATALHLQNLLKRKRVHMSTTRLHGHLYIRVCVLSFRSHIEKVDLLLAEIQREISSSSSYSS